MTEVAEVEFIEMGYLARETVATVKMDRSKFCELVEEVIAEGTGETEDYYGPIADDMRHTAMQVPHFPIGTWINPTRGCGCLVGEYLIAHDLITRHEGTMVLNVSAAIAKTGNASLLREFGNRIDYKVRMSLTKRGVNLFYGGITRDQSGVPRDVVVVFEDAA